MLSGYGNGHSEGQVWAAMNISRHDATIKFTHQDGMQEKL